MNFFRNLWYHIYHKERMLKILDESKPIGNSIWSYRVKQLGFKQKVFHLTFFKKIYKKNDIIKTL